MILIALFGIQFIPSNRNQSVEVLASDFTNIFDVPININQLLVRSCYDCHSNNTNYPWYNTLQPIAMLLENHITKAKEELNFSEFGEYSKRRQKSKLKSIRDQILKNKMPLTSYTIIHNDARLSDQDRIEIVEWADKLLESY